MRVLAIHPGASISTADVYAGYVKALKAQGHEVYQYLLDQRIDRTGSWLIHNWRKSGRPDPKPTAADILYWAGLPSLEMALRLLPDWIVVFSGMYFLKHFVSLFRRMGAPVAVVLSESPYDLEQEREYARLASLVFTNERSAVPALQEANPHVHYLPHAYDPDIHRPGGRDSLVVGAVADSLVVGADVVFIGTLFRERVELLSAVDWTGIDLALYGQTEALGSRSRLRQYVRGGYVDNAEAAEIYRRSRIGLNLYRQSKGFGRDVPRIEHAESLNPRAYELAACGTFQVSDHRAEVWDVFGSDVPTFSTAKELEGAIHGVLSCPPEQIRRVAERQRQCILPHTYAARAEQLTEVLRTWRPTRSVTMAS